MPDGIHPGYPQESAEDGPDWTTRDILSLYEWYVSKSKDRVFIRTEYVEHATMMGFKPIKNPNPGYFADRYMIMLDADTRSKFDDLCIARNAEDAAIRSAAQHAITVAMKTYGGKRRKVLGRTITKLVQEFMGE